MNPDALTCVDVEEEALAERYVAGVLPQAATDRFEAHLLGCARCQDAVRLAVAVRRASVADMLRPSVAPTISKPGRPRRLSPALRLAGVGALAAGLAAIAALRFGRDVDARDLGVLRQPPVYLGVPVRAEHAGTRAADSLFARGMRAYGDGDYRAAERALGASLAAGASPEPTEFFRGASLLVLDRPAEAESAFAHVLARGASPYAAEARYYRALGALRLGATRDALDELRAVASDSAAAIAPAARALAREVEARRRR